jgi:hypothetical protein
MTSIAQITIKKLWLLYNSFHLPFIFFHTRISPTASAINRTNSRMWKNIQSSLENQQPLEQPRLKRKLSEKETFSMRASTHVLPAHTQTGRQSDKIALTMVNAKWQLSFKKTVQRRRAVHARTHVMIWHCMNQTHTDAHTQAHTYRVGPLPSVAHCLTAYFTETKQLPRAK